MNGERDMTDWEETCEGLSRWLAGELEGDEAERVGRLGEGDERARRALSVLRRVEDAFARAPLEAPSALAAMKIKSAVREAAGVGRPRTHGPVLDLDEVAEYLRTDRATVLEHLDELPVFEFAGKFLVRLEALEAWVRERERRTRASLAAERRRVG